MAVLFFDVDGTLFSGKKIIPESAIEAIVRTRELGNKVFLNTGRTVSMIPEDVLKIGFDGIVASCGTYVSVGDKVILDHELSKEELVDSFRWLKEDMSGLGYEGAPCISVLEFDRYLERDFYESFIRDFGTPFRTIRDDEILTVHASKFSGVCRSENARQRVASFEKVLADRFEIQVHGLDASEKDTVIDITKGILYFECTPKAYDKAKGITTVMEYYGEDMMNSYAFGDSDNDLAMLNRAGHSICMGNGTERARAAAEYVTTAIMDHGIAKAMKHYELI